MCHTWVCGRDNSTKEKAIGVVELVSQLPGHLHQFDHTVHQVPAEVRDKRCIVFSSAQQHTHNTCNRQRALTQ